MGKVKQFKKEKVHPSPMNPVLIEAWNKGYSAGAKQQRETDIENLVKMLEDLESVPGIGEKRAWQLREHFLRKFGHQ